MRNILWCALIALLAVFAAVSVSRLRRVDGWQPPVKVHLVRPDFPGVGGGSSQNPRPMLLK